MGPHFCEEHRAAHYYSQLSVKVGRNEGYIREGRQGFLTSENDSRKAFEGAWNGVIYDEDGVIYFVIYDAK